MKDLKETPKVKKTKAAPAPEIKASHEHTGDAPKPQLKVPHVAAMPLDSSPVGNFTARASDLNTNYISGKKQGALVAVDGGGLAVATGEEDLDHWVRQGTGVEMVPIGNARHLQTSIGDRRVPVHNATLTALSIPLVHKDEMSNRASDLNTSSLSGKKLGSVVCCDETHYLFVATGSKDTDKWAQMNTNHAGDITPAGTARPDQTSSKVGDSRRKMPRGSAVTCVDFPVVDYTELSLKASALNSDPHGGKRAGAIVVCANGAAAYDILQAKGSDFTSAWQGMRTAAEVVPA